MVQGIGSIVVDQSASSATSRSVTLHLPSTAIHLDMTKELQTSRGWQILTLLLCWRFHVSELWSEGLIELAGTKCPCMDRP